MVQTKETSGEPGSEMHALRASEQGAGWELPVDVLEELLFAAGWRREACCAALSGLIEGADRGADDGEGSRITGFTGLGYYGGAEGLLEGARGALERLEEDLAGGTVGLFVGMPGSEGVLTEELARIHTSLLNRPGQALIVADPEARCLAFYVRAPGKGFRTAGWSVVYPAGDGESSQPTDSGAGHEAGGDESEYTERRDDQHGVSNGDADAESD